MTAIEHREDDAEDSSYKKERPLHGLVPGRVDMLQHGMYGWDGMDGWDGWME